MQKNFLFVFITSCLISSCFKGPVDPNPGTETKYPKLVEGHKVCVIGDSGKGHAGQDIVAKALKAEGCDSVRHTGDIIYNDGLKNRNDPEFEKKFYKQYGSMIEAGIPFYMSVGNHDYKLKPETWIELAKEYEAIKLPSMYYFDIYDNICFITIDTNSRFIEQNSWFKSLKKKYKKQCKLTLAFGHHPRYSAGKHGDAIYLFKLFLDTIIDGKVDAYFAGHDHNLEDVGTLKGTHYFVSGSAAEIRPLRRKIRNWALAKIGYMTFTIHYSSENNPYLKYYFYSVNKRTAKTTLERQGQLDSARGFR